jgi:predicted nucleic acid-binding protein
MIAAHAAEHNAILLSNDRAFGAVPGLRVEDWTAACSG